MTFVVTFTAWLKSRRLSLHNRTLNRRHQDISTVRYSQVKPPRVQGRSLTLFYRPRTFWVMMQVVFFAALAVWTVKNYVHVIKSF